MKFLRLRRKIIKSFKQINGYTRLSIGNANIFEEEVGLNYAGKKGFKLGIHARLFQSSGLDLLGRDTVYNIIQTYSNPQINNT